MIKNLTKGLVLLSLLSISTFTYGQAPAFTNPAPLEPFDVSSFLHEGVTEEFITTSEDRSPSSVTFNLDGTKMYITGSNDDAIVEYDLSIPFDVSTAIYAGEVEEFSVSSEDVSPDEVIFNPDGSKMFLLGADSKSIIQYSLNTPFDVSTASHDGIGEEFSVNNEESSPSGFTFNDDGTKMFVIGDFNRKVIEYSLSTAYDVSTASHVGAMEDLQLGSEASTLNAIKFNIDGTRMLILERSGASVVEYTLSSAFDVSTASYTGASEELLVTAQESFVAGMDFNPTGTKLFISGFFSDAVIEYTLATSIAFNENGTGSIINVDANDGQGGAADANITYQLQGADASLFNINASGEITFLNSPDFENPQDNDANNIYRIDVIAENNSNETTSTSLFIEIQDMAGPAFTQVGEGFDVSQASYAGQLQELLIRAEESSPKGLTFNNDGTKMFVIGQFGDAVEAYDLGTAFDVSTAVHISMIFDHHRVNSEESIPQSLAFDNTGTKLFVLGSNDDAIVEYTLSSAYDITTASYAGASEEFSVASEEPDPRGMRFNDDGTKLFVIGSSSSVIEYGLNPAYDVSTANYTGEAEEFSVDAQEGSPQSLAFSQDGTQMFVIGINQDRVLAYELSSAFDVSTAVFSGDNETLSIVNEASFSASLTFNNTGTKLFILDDSKDAIIEYDIPTTTTFDENDVSNVIDIDAVIGAGATDAGVTYSLSGTDAFLFNIGGAGALSFIASPDFESPQDDDADNVYVLDIIASSGSDQSVQKMQITVLDIDDTPPTITSETSTSFAENNTAIAYTITADEMATFTLGTTKDEALFNLVNDNEISFGSAPDFENPTDSDTDNDYLLDLIATDGLGNVSTTELTISVTDVDEIAPSITSGTSASIPENIMDVAYTATADETVTFSLGSMKDESFFTLANDNEISFTNLPDFDMPADGDGDNAYLIDLTATDGAGNATTIEVTINVTAADETAPAITSGTSASIEENSTDVAYSATADESATFTLGTTKDESLFTVANDNEIRFLSAPDFEMPLDGDTDNIYLIDLIATDIAGNASTIEVAITVTDVDDRAPVITSDVSKTVIESVSGVFYTALADEAVTFSLGSTKDESLFSLANDDEISFINQPVFDTPTDGDANNTYLIDLTATDGAGNVSTIEVAITVIPAVPVFTNLNGSLNIVNTVYAGAAEELSVLSEDFRPQSVNFNPDGTKMYIVGTSLGRIHEYVLSSPFDVSTATYLGIGEVFSTRTQEPSPVDFAFNDDGTKMFVAGTNQNSVFEYNLTTAYDVSTASYAGAEEDFSLDNDISFPSSIGFSGDGMTMLVGHSRNIIEYTLSAAYDVSTAVFARTTSNFENALYDFDFNADGSKLFIVIFPNKIVEYDLNTPYNVTSNSLVGEFSVNSEEETVRSMHINPRFRKAFILGHDGGAVVEYDIPFQVDYVEHRVNDVFDVNVNDGFGGASDANISYSLEGTDAASFSISASGAISFVSSPDFESPQDSDSDNVYDASIVATNASNNTRVTRRFISVRVTDLQPPVFTNVGEGFDVSRAVYAGAMEEFNINAETNSATDLAFNSDGTKMFIAGNFKVVEYQLSTAFDVSTAVYAGVNEELSVSDEERFINDLTFNTDGTKLFVVGSEGDAVVEYNLSTSFDISTAVHAGTAEEFSVNDRQTFPTGLAFSADGLQMFVAGVNDIGRVVHYQLSTAFDVSTAQHLGNSEERRVNNEEFIVEDVVFNTDGTKMFIIGRSGDAVVEYTLETPYDVSTSVHTGVTEEFRVISEETNATGLAFNANGTKLFVVGSVGDAVVEYQLPSVLTFNENATTEVIDVEANDGNGGDADVNITYSLQGTDANLFAISTTGSITFNTAPDFELPTDADEDNTYNFTVVAASGGELTTQDVILEVLDVDDLAPSITSDESTSVEENTTDVVYSATADETVTFSLGSNKDESLFTLANDNEISFIDAPDFEAPSDSNTDNDYLIDLTATDDAGNTSTLEVTITVTDVDDTAPSITSETSATVEENSTGVVYAITADETVTFSLGTSKDESNFSLANDSEISFNTSPDFETPGDADADNTYLLDITATDDAGNASTIELAVSVTDIDEVAPTITSGTSVSIAENSSDIAYTATADESVTFSLGSSKDESFFTLANANEISFTSSPDFEMPADANADNDYLIDLTATDDAGNATTIEVTITVTSADETAPTITSGSSTSIAENSTDVAYTATADETVTFTLGSSKDESFFTLANDNEISFTNPPDFEMPADANADNDYLIDLTATDGAGNATTIEVTITVISADQTAPSITSGSSASIAENSTAVAYTATADESVTFSIGSNKDESFFTLANGNEISFTDLPDFENPADEDADNDYLIDLTATDGAGNATTIEVTITVTSADDVAPAITSGTTASIAENSENIVYTATADESVSFSLGSSKDESFFTLANDNEISFTNSPDFENPLDANADNEYLIDLTATDGAGNTTTIEIVISVTDVDEIAPTITSGTSVSVAENTIEVVYIAEADESATFSLGMEKDESLFTLANDNEVSFTNSPDFEMPTDSDSDNQYLIDLIATDGAGNATTIELNITVTDVDDTAPSITSGATGSVEENSTVIAYTATADELVTFSLGTSKDESFFTLANSNEISFTNSPDFENPMDANADNVYLLDLMAVDDAGNSTTLELSITVQDVVESAPEITSSSAIEVAENTEGVVYVATANETVVFTLGTSKDEAQFALTNGNEISFITTPDFETPLDADQDNAYVVDLIATNAVGLSSTLEITFTVSDLDEVAPSITSGVTASFEENGTGVAYTITADESATFSLGTSKDEALFLLENENEISFATIPDFETPGDTDGDNVYLLDITAIDEAGNSSAIELSISVTDVNENVLSTSVPVPNLKVYPNPASDILIYEVDQAERVTITDLTGRKMNVPAVGDEKLLDISDLPEGIYILRIQTSNNIYQQKFTKK